MVIARWARYQVSVRRSSSPPFAWGWLINTDTPVCSESFAKRRLSLGIDEPAV